MTTFIMLTRLSHEVLKRPNTLLELSHQVSEHIRQVCLEVEWKASYAVLGPADYVDIFVAPDIETAMKVATLIRTFGHATTEIWPATEWEGFSAMVRSLPQRTAAVG
jgi:uncharacterized protein with GYD domain